MSMYVVERELPGITPEALQSAGVRAKTCCAEMTTEGEPVKWIRSFFLPQSAQTHCYFEAGSQQAVEEGESAREDSVCARGGSGRDDARSGVSWRHAGRSTRDCVCDGAGRALSGAGQDGGCRRLSRAPVLHG